MKDFDVLMIINYFLVDPQKTNKMSKTSKNSEYAKGNLLDYLYHKKFL